MSWLISLAGKEAPTSDCQNVMIQRFSVDQQLVVLTPMALKCMVRNSKERELSEQSRHETKMEVIQWAMESIVVVALRPTD